MQITGVVVLVGLSIILFEVFPEKSVWSIPVRQIDEHMIAVPVPGGLSLLLGQKNEAYKTLTKEQQRFWKRILIVLHILFLKGFRTDLFMPSPICRRDLDVGACLILYPQ